MTRHLVFLAPILTLFVSPACAVEAAPQGVAANANPARYPQQGVTWLRVRVTTEGGVGDCVVSTSSGSERLDRAACELARAKWRWNPAPPAETDVQVQVDWLRNSANWQ